MRYTVLTSVSFLSALQSVRVVSCTVAYISSNYLAYDSNAFTRGREKIDLYNEQITDTEKKIGKKSVRGIVRRLLSIGNVRFCRKRFVELRLKMCPICVHRATVITCRTDMQRAYLSTLS